MSRVVLSVFLLMVFGGSAAAGEKDLKQVKAELVRSFPELAEATVKPAPVPGLYEIEFDAKIFYTTQDGKYLFMGDLVEVGTRQNITEGRRATRRLQALDGVGEGNMIVMGPSKPKRTLTVFTDVDCPYCARFHLDVPALNRAGVKVRYLFYPREGLASESYKKSVAVWCDADRVKAIGVAKAGGKLNMRTCPNPVEKHYQLGGQLEIRGTPTIFFDDGKIIPGYVPAPRLLEMLGIKSETTGSAAR
jgi:thiol:disulfide interchange protein DsbC